MITCVTRWRQLTIGKGHTTMVVATNTRALNNGDHCGDVCKYWSVENKIILCMTDGLGHGKAAENAGQAAIDYVAGHLSDPLDQLFHGCNRAISHTRGVAMGIAIIDEKTHQLVYAGINNTRALLVGERNIYLSSNSGIIGAGFKRLHLQQQSFEPGNIIMLYTDGFPELIDLSRFTDLSNIDLQSLAESILNEQSRNSDDAGILIYRMDAMK